VGGEGRWRSGEIVRGKRREKGARFEGDGRREVLTTALRYRGTVGTILGAWFGAIPIPLDW